LFDLTVAEPDGDELIARDDSMLARCQLSDRVIPPSGGRNLLDMRVSPTGSEIAPGLIASRPGAEREGARI
jgi:hypothetical protein